MAEETKANTVRLLSRSKWTQRHLEWLGVKHDIEDQYDLERNVFGAQFSGQHMQTVKVHFPKWICLTNFRDYSGANSSAALRNARRPEGEKCSGLYRTRPVVCQLIQRVLRENNERKEIYRNYWASRHSRVRWFHRVKSRRQCQRTLQSLFEWFFRGHRTTFISSVLESRFKVWYHVKSFFGDANSRGNLSSKYQLGEENVVVQNDGAIVLSRYSNEWKSIWGIPRIVSLEVVNPIVQLLF